MNEPERDIETIEPCVVSRFWVQYYRPGGTARERCICGSTACAVKVVKDEDGTERRVGVEIQDGRLVYVHADGLILYLCFLERGRSGRSPAPVERGTRVAKTPPPSPGNPPSLALVAGLSRFLRFLWRRS